MSASGRDYAQHLSVVRFAFLTIVLLSLAACVLTVSPSHIPDTPSGLSESERDVLRDYALSLINEARTNAGLNELTLDSSPAAQFHAEDMTAHCTRGHWSTDGMKPYMRYTLAGGEQYSAENVFAIDFCPNDLDQYALETPREQIDFAMDRFLDSPGHRQNILNPHHRKVGIGLTYRAPTIWFVQLFVGDYIEYQTKPTIDSGILTLSGQFKNGAHVSSESGTIAIYFDPPLEPLTRGQLSRTYCYTNGLAIAGIRPPPGEDWSYAEDETTINVDSLQCPDPYDIPSDVPPPTSNDEAHDNWQQALDSSRDRASRQLTYPWITADQWTVHGENFAVTANVTEVLSEHGNGVYTILLWGEINDERVPISEYSIFIPSLR